MRRNLAGRIIVEYANATDDHLCSLRNHGNQTCGRPKRRGLRILHTQRNVPTNIKNTAQPQPSCSAQALKRWWSVEHRLCLAIGWGPRPNFTPPCGMGRLNPTRRRCDGDEAMISNAAYFPVTVPRIEPRNKSAIRDLPDTAPHTGPKNSSDLSENA